MGASQKTQQSSVSTYTPTPAATDMYNNVFSRANDVANNTNYNPATAKTIADFSPDQLAAMGMVRDSQGNWQPGINNATANVDQAARGITGGDISQFYNPYESDVINATMADIDKQNAMDRRNYTANEVSQGALGGSGYGLGLGALTGNQSQARNTSLANLRSGGFDRALAAAQADKARQLSAGQAQAGIAQLGSQLNTADITALMNTGNQQQTQQQAVNDAASQNATQQQLFPMQMAQWLASIGSGIGPLMGGTTAGSGSATTSQGKGIGNVLGGALTLAGMASDERVKENISVIGKTFDGQKIYKFNYKGDPRSQIGLMAQDVENEHPEAVREIGGVKHVNYDEALGDSYASGGRTPLSFDDGLLGWADIRPAQMHVPDLPRIDAPQAPKDSFDPQAAYDMGKKGRGGIESLLGGASSAMPAASSPAGGAMAASGLQGLGGGGLGGLGALFGFADGGAVDDDARYREIARRLMPRLIQQESGGRDDVVSSKGATGVTQVMPDTAREPGFGVAPMRDQSRAEHLRFGEDYLTAMVKRYAGDEDAALIAYNGGPARADDWLNAGRNDKVIPAESANYYRSIKGMPPAVAALVGKGTNSSSEAGEKYSGKSDRATGGMLKSMFGVDFNPLGLTEPERRALMVAGLSMLSSGDVGKGGLTGMQYLAGAEAGESERSLAAAKLRYEMQKDKDELALKTRAQDLSEKKETREGQQFERTQGFTEGQANRTYGLDLDKFNHTAKTDEQKAAWEREKTNLELGKPSEDMKEWALYARQEQDAGRTPLGLFEYMKQLKEAGRSQTNVSVSGEKKGAEEMAKGFAKMYGDLRSNATAAQTVADQLDSVESALDAGVRTGVGADSELFLRKLALTMGVPGFKGTEKIDKLAKAELMKAVSGKLALAVRAPNGEAGGMPGSLSDSDREFLRTTVPSMLNTPEGNRQLVYVMRAAAARHQAIFDMAVDYAEEHDGQLGPGFDRQVREYVKDHPLSDAVRMAPFRRPDDTKEFTPPGAGGKTPGFSVIEVR